MDIHDTNSIVICIIVLLFLLLFLKNVFQYKKSAAEKIPPFAFLLCLLAYILLLPIGTLTLLVFALYRNLVSFVLKIKYGSEFRGLLEGADAIYTVEGAKSVINVLLICEYDERRYSQSPYETARQTFYNLYFRDPERFPKFLCSFHKFMGYSFMLKNQVTIDECVTRMKTLEGHTEQLDREHLVRLITDCSNSPLPKNGTILWEVLVGTQAVNWSTNNDNTETRSYPIMFRVHHSVADGVSLIKLLVGAFADNPNAEIVSPERWKEYLVSEDSQKNINRVKETECLKEKVLRFYKNLHNNLGVLLMTAYVLCLAPTTFYLQTCVKANDRNILQGPTLSGQSVVALNAEVSQEYVKKVKRIKGRIPGTAFSEVILTAFSASLNDHFVKNSPSCPRSITALIPVLSGSSELKQLTPGSYDIDVNLKNKFSLLYLKLPLCVINDGDCEENKPVLKRLKLLHTEFSALKKSVDYVVNHWILSIGLGLFTHSIVNFFIYLTRCTILTSVLPGPPKVTLCGGSSIQDVAFWVPHMGHTGISFSVLTYDGRLQMGLNVDKALISDEKAAESIVNGVYKYIDILDQETS